MVRAPVYTEQGQSQGKYDNQTESYEEKVTDLDLFNTYSSLQKGLGKDLCSPKNTY